MKKLFVGVGLILLLGLTVAGLRVYQKGDLGFQLQPVSTPTPEGETLSLELEPKSVELVLVFDEDQIFNYPHEVKEPETVFDVLTTVLSEEGMDLETKEYDFGILVESIDGLENTSQKAWIYFVNDEAGEVAADKQEVKAGDKIEWKYIAPSF